MNLRVKDIHTSAEYEVWHLNYGPTCIEKQLRIGDVLEGNKVHHLQIRKKVYGCSEATAYFDIPCHHISTFALLLNVEANSCIKQCNCKKDK